VHTAPLQHMDVEFLEIEKGTSCRMMVFLNRSIDLIPVKCFLQHLGLQRKSESTQYSSLSNKYGDREAFEK